MISIVFKPMLILFALMTQKDEGNAQHRCMRWHQSTLSSMQLLKAIGRVCDGVEGLNMT